MFASIICFSHICPNAITSDESDSSSECAWAKLSCGRSLLLAIPAAKFLNA
jgi:hypothetical protein